MRSPRSVPAVRCLLVLLGAGVFAGCGRRERTFDGDRAYRHLVDQVEFGPRVPGSGGHRRTLRYLLDHLEGKADRVRIHRFEALSPLDSSEVVLETVVAVFGEQHSTRILFGAHWDTRPVADQEEDERLRRLPVPGANDGASGTAVLLEIATALGEVPPDVGVDLVFFDGEDSGRPGEPETFALGSRRFVEDHPAYRPALVVILDMVGRKGGRILKERNSVILAGPVVERIWELGRELGIGILVDAPGKPIYDDHVPFLRAGIPAVDLIDVEDPDWHTTRDLPANCAPEPLADVGRLVLGLIRAAERGQHP